MLTGVRSNAHVTLRHQAPLMAVLFLSLLAPSGNYQSNSRHIHASSQLEHHFPSKTRRLRSFPSHGCGVYTFKPCRLRNVCGGVPGVEQSPPQRLTEHGGSLSLALIDDCMGQCLQNPTAKRPTTAKEAYNQNPLASSVQEFKY